MLTSFLNFASFSFYAWDWTYLFINIVGAFAFGFLISMFRRRFPSKGSKWYAFLSEGAAASFTVFDLVFSQISLLFLQPDIWVLIFYVAVNFAACIVSSYLGVFLGSGKKIAKRGRAGRQLPHAGPKKGASGARHGY